MKKKFRPRILSLIPVVIFALGLDRMELAADSPADKTRTPSTSDGWVEYYPYEAPNSGQTKFEFSGTDATPIPNSGGKALLKGVKIKQFALTGGKPQMVAETPECIADSRFKEIGSAGRLTVHAQDDKFFVEGLGFFLRQAESRLVISNEVHSIIQAQSVTNAPAPPGTEIFSHRAEFQMKTEATNGVAIYQGAVRVNDPKMRMTCELLTADLPESGAGKTNQLKRIVAETNVVIDFTNEKGERTHATGQRAVHDYQTVDGVSHELLELTGDPRVDLTNGWMTADVFVMDRTTGKLRGKRDFHFHYFAPNPQPKAAETEISSDQFELDTGSRLAQFWGGVRVNDARMKLASETLSAILPQPEAANHFKHILAETNVAIDLPDEKTGQNIHATGQKAVYDYQVVNTATNEVLVLTGNPAVETTKPAGWMTADVVTVDRARGTISGAGNDHSVIKKQPGESAAMDTEIFSEQFEFSNDTGLAVYRGQARAYDPEMNSSSKTLTIKLAKDAHGRTNPVERIEAEGDVVMDFIEKAFAPDDLTNLTSFAARLNQPAKDDGVARYVGSHLTAATQLLLTKYSDGTNTPLQQALAADLNRLTQSGSIYEAKRFTNVYLSLETSALMERQPLGVELVALNRLLLLDAFRGELRKGESGEKTHATGDRAVFAYKVMGGTTNEMLELSGHPNLIRPNEHMTAGDTIIYNRTTGSWQAMDKAHFYMTFKDMKKMPGGSKKPVD